MHQRVQLFAFALLLLLAAVALGGCSAKKNTAGSRFWQAMNTRYNVYYHGRTHYDEQIKELEEEYEDDYSQHVFVHPAEARSNPKAPQPKGSFDRTIEKMQKAIALHSIKKKPKKKSGKSSDPKYKEWMAREEYNPFMHNCWYLLAKAQYMKGDFLNAAATFRYISRHFSWKPTLVQEAQVWEALSYCALGWPGEAENVLSRVHIDQIEDARVRGLANLAMADFYIKDHQTETAIPYLSEAVKKAKGAQKVRLNFLLGQLYQENGQDRLAYEAYKRAGSSNSSSYRTKFNARIRQSAVYQGTNVESEVRALRRMTRYDRNKEYQDQIYYAIGNLYLAREDTTHAIENYIKAAEKSTRNGIDKAISQLTLGQIYFTRHQYDLAQPCYAEAVPQLSEEYPNYKQIKHRSDVLDELAVYAGNVTLQDSLLRLSNMTDEEVKAVIKKIIDELKKKEKEEKENADREKYLAEQSAKGKPIADSRNKPEEFSINNDKSWYFYNTATKNAGKTAFQQLWGNRKLEDNWRRRNKNTFSFGDEEQTSDSLNVAASDSLAGDSTQVDKEALKRAEDPHYEEYYLKQIPRTEEQVQAAHDVIQEGLYNMGVILKDKLEDYDAAADEFNKLLTQYPDNTYRLDTYYNMYLMYMRRGDVAKANTYRDIILAEFAESKEGKALQDPNYIDNLRAMNTEQERLYQEAYDNYLANNNQAVHHAYEVMMEKYPLSKIMPKFMFIDALSYVSERDYDKFKSTIKDMLQRYPDTDITPVASGIVKNLNAGRKLEGGGSNARGMLWSTRLSNDTTPADLERKFTPFKEDNDKPQVFILLYPTDSVSSNLLLYEVARHNFNSFVVKDYDMEQMNFGRLGLLVVKGFQNFKELTHYKTIFEQDQSLSIPPQVHQVLISESNFQLLLSEGRSFEDYFNYLEHKNDTDVEGQVPELTGDEPDGEDQTTEGTTDGPETKSKAKEKSKSKKTEPKKAEQKKAEEPKPEVKSEIKPEPKPEVKSEVKPEPKLEVKSEVKPEPKTEVKSEIKPEPKPEVKSETKQENEPATVVDTATHVDSITPTPSSSSIEPTTPAETPTRSVRDKKQKSKASAAPESTRTKKEQTKPADKPQPADAKSQSRDESQRLKELDKIAKQKAKEAERAEKERLKAEEKAEKHRQDSINREQREQERLLELELKAKEDSIREHYKTKEELARQKRQERIDAKKQQERERKEKLKAREQERKQKAKERKERQKQREKERKEREKQKKQAAKEREQERKQAAKEKAEQRRQAQKDREQERKQRIQENKDKQNDKKQSGANPAVSGKEKSADDSSPKVNDKSTPSQSTPDRSVRNRKR